MCNRKIVSSNHNKMIRAHHVVYTLISENINVETKYIYGLPTTIISM